MNNLKEWIEIWLSRIPNNLEVRPLRPNTYQPIKALFSRDIDEIDTYIRGNDDCHVFFGVLGRQGQTGDKESVTELHCLWADIDFKDLPDGQVEADGLIATFDIQPTLVIASGGGYHLYWFLMESITDLAKAERVLRGLAVRLKADIKSAEVARILRVPFSHNWKYSPAKEVTVLRYEPENEYNFEDFLAWELKDDPRTTTQDDTEWFKEGRRDRDLHYTGCRLLDGGASTSNVEDVLTRLVSSWGEHDPRWVQAKVKAALKTISKERAGVERRVIDYVETLTGQTSLLAMTSWLGLQGDAKYQAEKVLHHLAKEQKITWVSNAHGVFRPIDSNPCLMNLDDPAQDTAPIDLPFDLHTIVCLYPKNVIICAGEKNAGKTAFSMNAAYMNRDTMPVTYFNSEMGTAELQARIRKFPFPYNEWKKIRWIELAHRFEDLIDPNGFNVIDFLEVGKEAFTVTEDIRRAFDKLEKGLLLIVMQKRVAKDYAVGGEGTLEKARLAINLKRLDMKNVCQITVAKNWTGVIHSPRGYECEYHVYDGGKMKMEGKWYRPEKTTTPTKPKGFPG